MLSIEVLSVIPDATGVLITGTDTEVLVLATLLDIAVVLVADTTIADEDVVIVNDAIVDDVTNTGEATDEVALNVGTADEVIE